MNNQTADNWQRQVSKQPDQGYLQGKPKADGASDTIGFCCLVDPSFGGLCWGGGFGRRSAH
jgi:hypothetical protein